MGWFDKIKFTTETRDNSPELKKGEIKDILISSFKTLLPDFSFSTYKNQTYYFLRERQFKCYTVTETLDIIFSLKDKHFSCSISSRLNKTYVYDKNYNIGKINPCVDLIVLKTGKRNHSINEAYYFHNGREENTTKVVNELAHDFKSFGLPFLNTQFDNLTTDKILNTGFDYIEQLTQEKSVLKNEIETERKNVGYIVSRIKHPVYIDLKEKLQSIPNQDTSNRQNIPSLSFELLELYWDN